jgi:hypothetical protein
MGNIISNKPLLADFVATDDSGGFLNLTTGDVFNFEEMLSRFSRAEVESIPTGHRDQRPVSRRQLSRSIAVIGKP